MLERCKCVAQGEVQFVRSVQAAPQPLCVLCTDTQLKQVQLSCTDPSNSSVLSVDPTFNLGTFFVTLLVLFVCKRTQKHPVFLGPLLIHQQMNAQAYSYFAHQIQILLPLLKEIRVFGSDGEKALTNAFESAFSNALHSRCFKHFQDNCEAKLKSLNLDATSREEILADIFGETGSEVIQIGLADTVDPTDFAKKLSGLEERRRSLVKWLH